MGTLEILLGFFVRRRMVIAWKDRNKPDRFLDIECTSRTAWFDQLFSSWCCFCIFVLICVAVKLILVVLWGKFGLIWGIWWCRGILASNMTWLNWSVFMFNYWTLKPVQILMLYPFERFYQRIIHFVSMVLYVPRRMVHACKEPPPTYCQWQNLWRVKTSGDQITSDKNSREIKAV